MMINPYKDIKWSTVEYVPSVTHVHCTNQARFDKLYSLGIRHFPISNYYPSEPIYPLTDKFNVPDDVISCPNAEHHHVTNWDSYLHFCSLGSFFSSGNQSGVEPIGVNSTWQSAFSAILDDLQFDTGGGITINHPVWSSLSVRQIERLLDYDDRVLGIEVYNHSASYLQESTLEKSLKIWDELLKTGRRVWGFFVFDHASDEYDPILGRNILLLSEKSEQNALEAYRNGAFFGAMKGSGLFFTDIQINGNVATVETNYATTISAIIDGKKTSISGNVASFNINTNSVYLRFEAVDGQGETIYSQPIIFRDKKTLDMAKRKKVLLMTNY